eukprot:120565-Pelagomonas_calceolata.AAC.6
MAEDPQLVTSHSLTHTHVLCAGCLVAEGPRLVTSLLMATADAVSRNLARPLAGTLWAVLQCDALGSAGREWVVAAMQSPEFAGAVAVCAAKQQDDNKFHYQWFVAASMGLWQQRRAQSLQMQWL